MTQKPVARPIEVVSARPRPVPKTPNPDVAGIPEGSIEEVLGWVGDDAQRASAALLHEEEGKGRKTLVTRLNELTENEKADISTFEAEGGSTE